MKKITVEDLIKQAETRNQKSEADRQRLNDLSSVVASNDAVQLAVVQSAKLMLQYLQGATHKATVENFPDPVTSVSTPDIEKVVEEVRRLNDSVKAQGVDFTPVVAVLNEIQRIASTLPTEYPAFPEFPQSFEVTNLESLQEALKIVGDKIDKQKLDPKITVKPTDVKIDLKPLTKKLDALLEKDFSPNIEFPEQVPLDLLPLLAAVDNVANTVAEQTFPVPNFTSAFKDSDGAPVSAVIDSDGSVPSSKPILKKLIDDTTTTDVTYIGEAALGSATSASVWRIKKIDESSGVSITWSGTGFDVEWDDRVSVSYS